MLFNTLFLEYMEALYHHHFMVDHWILRVNKVRLNCKFRFLNTPKMDMVQEALKKGLFPQLQSTLDIINTAINQYK